jgi:G3E family GTPase
VVSVKGSSRTPEHSRRHPPPARVRPARRPGTSLFDLERAPQAPGWVRELNGDHVPETEEYGISSTVFRSRLPFHPGRLWTLVTEELDSGAYGQILRSKGFFTLASRFIGMHLHAALTDCLMADAERLSPTDPFPTWDTYGIEDTCDHERPELVAGH